MKTTSGEPQSATETRYTLSGNDDTEKFAAPGTSGTEAVTAPAQAKTGDAAAGAAPLASGENNTENDEFSGLYLMDTKERVNSRLTFDKVWDDDNNKWDDRPDSIYIKIIRNKRDIVTANVNGIFKVTSAEVDRPSGSVSGEFKGQIRGLPAGVGETRYEYRFVQCNSSGTVTDQTDYGTAFTEKDGETESITVRFSKGSIEDQNLPVWFRLQRRLGETGEFENVRLLDNKLIDAELLKDSTSQTVVTEDNNGQPVSTTIGGTVYLADSNGVIEIPVSDNIEAEFDDLAYGENSGGDIQNNGSFSQYYYTIVECDEYGNDISD